MGSYTPSVIRSATAMLSPSSGSNIPSLFVSTFNISHGSLFFHMAVRVFKKSPLKKNVARLGLLGNSGPLMLPSNR